MKYSGRRVAASNPVLDKGRALRSRPGPEQSQTRGTCSSSPALEIKPLSLTGIKLSWAEQQNDLFPQTIE